MKVIVSYICPPIPIRSMDWEATIDSYNGDEANAPRGFGHTRVEAVADLASQLEDDLDIWLVQKWMNDNVESR